MYGLRLPSEPHLIRKSIGLLVSHEDMLSLGKCCPGKSHPDHTCHTVVAGSAKGIGAISAYAGQYTPSFVDAVLRTVPVFARRADRQLIQLPDATELHECEALASAKAELHAPDDETINKALTKVHQNLGHPSASDLVRVLKHGGASDRAIELARTFSYEFCKSQVKPHVPLPAKTSPHTQFNQCIGIDVKYLDGWKPGQKVKSLNTVDQASCFQVAVPFHDPETSSLLQELLDTHWISWAGPPESVVLDPAQTMLGEALQHMFESCGTVVRLIAAEAHWQLGRTENHGGWFNRVLSKVIQEQVPADRLSWESCVRHAHVKNQMIQNYRYTTHQYVFGRNPSLPGDLLGEPLHVVSGTAGLTDEAIEKAQSIRTSARRAVVELQDDKALRQALLARPRVPLDFQAGELVAYWREQKYSKAQGTVSQGGQWHGTAMVIGKVGRNFVTAHRKQIFRCAPEQLRLATTEERASVSTPEAELLGIKDLIEGGTFKGKQYVDLVPGQYPPSSDVQGMSGEPPSTLPGFPRSPEVIPEPELSSEKQPGDAKRQESVSPTSGDVVPEQEDSALPSGENPPEEASSSYGPIRRRVHGKSDEAAMFRPPAMRESDFIELMREVVPQLIDQAMEETRAEADSRPPAVKRSCEASEAEAPAASKPRHDSGSEEVLAVEEVDACGENIEAPIAAHIRKKATKELPHSNNDPKTQELINASKSIEWNTILEKGAVKIHYGKKAQQLKQQFPHRFIGSRFVITRQAVDESIPVDVNDPSSYRIKSRWCLQGHLDPDLEAKAEDGALQPPTLSQPSRVMLMQLLVSHGWELQLGDIEGAFMEAGPLDAKYRPLYARIPAGGIPMFHMMQCWRLLGTSMVKMMHQLHGIALFMMKQV